MNTGLQDVANLAWKLAAVLREPASDLLDTYDAERRPVGRQVVTTSDRRFSAVAGKTGWEATLRDWLARPAAAAISNLKPIQRGAFRTLAEIDISYAPTAYGEDAALELGDAAPNVGKRAPNAAIARHRDVFDLTTGYGFTVLALSRKPLEREEAHRAADGFVTSAEVFDACGLRERDAQAVCVVQPDGYVAWRGDGPDMAGAEVFLTWFGAMGAASSLSPR